MGKNNIREGSNNGNSCASNTASLVEERQGEHSFNAFEKPLVPEKEP